MNLSYDPFNPVFSDPLHLNSSGYCLEERSRLKLKKHTIEGQSVWLMMGLSFVAKENCFYARKMWNKELVFNKKFYLQDMEDGDETRSQMSAKAILKATRELHQCNLQLTPIAPPTQSLKAGINIVIKPEKKDYSSPSIVITVSFSGLELKQVRFSRTLNHFNSECFSVFYSQIKQYVTLCLEQQQIITGIDVSEFTDTSATVEDKQECKKLLKNAVKIYIDKHIPLTSSSQIRISQISGGYQFIHNNDHKKVFLESAYFDDVSFLKSVMHIKSHHCFLKDSQEKVILNKKEQLIASCCHKIQPSSGISGVVVQLDRRAQKLLLGGIIGKTASGSYRTKNITVKEDLKSAFDYVIDEHIKAFDLPTLSKKQRHDLYVTLQGSILVRVPNEYLLPISTILDGVEVTINSKIKNQSQLKSGMPQYELLYERLINKPFKKTGICGVNVEVNNGSANVIAVVKICPKKGRVYKTFSIRAYGLHEAFVLALKAYRAGFKLPTLDHSEMENLYFSFTLSIRKAIPAKFHYKLEQGEIK